MPDDKQGRNKQAANEEQRQRERALQEARDRADEPAPGEQLGDLDDALEIQDYPTTTEQLVENYGDYEVETQGGLKPVDEVLAPVDNELYDSADEVRDRIQRLINRR
ncbi:MULTISPECIES: DUF5789 family protein [Haloferax]|uniref:Uncharacterized protein n=2 Tax=Haloferax gibbonsii TaxID=35746 RepID=A0A0K1IUR5_HALGI|nr:MULTISPECIES: hypothetical protein [Haloferax]AKU08070.1 hypothetical protein ABY42_10075 [Haloferax gibbonsii]ELZ80013.1 hypothetical protein C454_12453 [Haloferax gibbonsii ATCC 33959]QOS12829.1 uncharacterized protein HfgLR_13505 [Haloferax gibbonsii]RDZ52784.1 hypothetical protein C5C07_13560 [Haloferax sp. Atlit-4N]REA02109.1 hypothetical protein DEQ92_14525 [Haloferax sp. Atlit-6N]